MSIKQIVLMLILLTVMFFMYNVVGLGITTLFLALVLLAQAIVFTIKSDNFDKFLKFLNPKMYRVYIEKDEEFIKKKRKISIASYYILSIILMFNGFIKLQSESTVIINELFSVKNYLFLSAITLIIGIVINFFSKIIMKKSRTASEDLEWSLILSLVMAGLVMSCIVVLKL